MFLDYISGTTDRIGDIRPFLEAAENGTVDIVTSTFTVAEVAFAHAEKQSATLDPTVVQKIDALWAIGGPVRLAEFTLLTAESAREIIRKAVSEGWSLSANDAIHLATAKRLGVDEVHTYDNGWSKYASDLGLRIVEPLASHPQLAL